MQSVINTSHISMSDILSAIEKALENTPAPTKSPASDRIIADLKAHYANETDIYKAFSTKIPELANVNYHLFSRPETRLALLCGVELLPADKLATLKDLAAEHAAAIIEQCTWGPAAAHRDHVAQREKIHAVALDRKAAMPDVQFRSKESFVAEYQEKNRAITERLKLIVNEAYTLCLEAVMAVENHLAEMLRAMEEGERNIAAGYGLSWEPSQLWKAAACNLLRARMHVRHFTGRPDQGPAQLLEGFVTFN